jgi:hypothetical protein
VYISKTTMASEITEYAIRKFVSSNYGDAAIAKQVSL